MKVTLSTTSLLLLLTMTGCGKAPATPTTHPTHTTHPTQKAFASDPATESPVNGFWAGRWKADAEQGEGKQLTCETIQVSEDEWKATFNAVCDKDYSFTMDMPGKRVGDEVVFEVSVDLGEAFGGEYHWTGKVIGEEFNGEYTNAKYNGTFKMSKSDEAAVNAGAYCEVPEQETTTDAKSEIQEGSEDGEAVPAGGSDGESE